MPGANRTIVIARPLDQVFGFFSDPVNDRSWRSHVKEISTADPPGVGRKIHQVVAGPRGRGIAADIEVTAYEPPSRYEFQVVAGPARPRGTFRFIETPNGTEVHFTLAAELGGIKKWFLSGPVQRSMDGEMAGLDTAKRLLEAS
ncbi:MAG TPA: SRPBCC family protein [Candidatus Limnocylindrales bacterium]|nr:SRPBCC family protein [Candidatus Limnocylindrales bacterium]